MQIFAQQKADYVVDNEIVLMGIFCREQGNCDEGTLPIKWMDERTLKKAREISLQMERKWDFYIYEAKELNVRPFKKVAPDEGQVTERASSSNMM
ncbi:unnamed protein product [Haemonchus placei]|uniref:Tyrosine-protein phosphatase domain-containing protein n=1 Tax=Haemonchus placei TaxID=6290 RepID=A0A0N4X7J4_HAEPC|nr:unnamed protein product [Haemonchus placei]